MKKIVLLIIFVATLSACDIASPPKEIKSALTFNAEITRDASTIYSEFNQVLMNQAIKNGQSTVPQLKSANETESDEPDRFDLIIRAVFTKEELTELASERMGIRDKRVVLTEEELSKIDFNSHWALVVSHPQQGMLNPALNPGVGYGSISAMYLDTLLFKWSPDERLNLKLKSRTLGTSQAFPLKWTSNVYPLERGDYKSIQVAIDDKFYNYDIPRPRKE